MPWASRRAYARKVANTGSLVLCASRMRWRSLSRSRLASAMMSPLVVLLRWVRQAETQQQSEILSSEIQVGVVSQAAGHDPAVEAIVSNRFGREMCTSHTTVAAAQGLAPVGCERRCENLPFDAVLQNCVGGHSDGF